MISCFLATVKIRLQISYTTPFTPPGATSYPSIFSYTCVAYDPWKVMMTYAAPLPPTRPLPFLARNFASRPDVSSIMHIHSRDVLAVSCLEMGLQCYAQDTVPFYGRVNYYDWDGVSDDHDEQEALGNSLTGLTAEGYTPHTLMVSLGV